MPRNAASGIQNNFTGGFVTQATALNFPANAAFEQNNVVFSEKSIVSRRNGFDYENNYTLKTLDRGERAQSTFHWKNASGDGLTNLVVQQNGETLYFYDTGNELSLSRGISANSVALSSFIASGATTANLQQNECQYSSGLGYLFVVHPYCDPFYVKYNSDGTFSSSIIAFTIRDTIGLPEAGVLVDARVGTLTDTHKYNLYNQGWNSTRYTTFFTGASSTYPSNADVWWVFKDSSDAFVVDATTLASNSRGSTPAPQGFFRLNPWNTSRAAIALAQAGITVSLSGDETSGTLRPSVTEFHAGRVFYAGVNATGYNSRIYFSRIVQGTADFGHCAATYDPTSETLFDYLPSDGGIISIPQAGTIFRLVSLGPTLLVFGANGVWALSGSTGVGFTATDYQLTPVGYIRSISGASFVIVDNTVMWWNNTGIWAIGQTSQGMSVKSITDDKIKDFFIDLPNESKRYARGVYNPRTHTIQWLYRSEQFGSLVETYTYDTVLSFNTLINAFYTWSIDTSSVALTSLVVIEGAGSIIGSDIIVDNSAVTVVDNNGETLITYGFSRTAGTTSTKYLVHNGAAFTFAECFNVDYLDWVQAELSLDYTSYFITGYNVATQGERRFQTNYIFVFSDMSEGTNNSYTFQALWNYGNSGNSGEWTQRQNVSQTITHAETYYDASRRRLKVRGSGTAVQFKFSSNTGLPFNIVGWSTYDTANQAV